MRRRVGELVGLAVQATFFLVIDLLLGIAGAIRAIQGAHASAYILGLFTAVLLAAILAWVAYRALVERDRAISGRRPVTVEHHHHYYEPGGGPKFIEGEDLEGDNPEGSSPRA